MTSSTISRAAVQPAPTEARHWPPANGPARQPWQSFAVCEGPDAVELHSGRGLGLDAVLGYLLGDGDGDGDVIGATWDPYDVAVWNDDRIVAIVTMHPDRPATVRRLGDE